MPNYCNNNIVITGPNSVIDKIEKIANGDKGDLLQYFYPMPKELNDTVAGPEPKTKKEKLEKRRLQVEYGASNWYDWRVENWGTKWDIMEFYNINRKEIGEDESEISLGFDTAWAPALGAYEKFLDKNSNCSLKAYYYEPGCDFMGEWDNGVDDCYAPSDYKSDDDFWQDGVGSTLDDYFGITESMAEYEAEQEEERLNEDVYKYSKGEKINIGEDA